MPYVLCELDDGLRPSEATVAVEDSDGRREYLRVERHYVKQIDGRPCLPIGIIHGDNGGVLIELPHEADSGANRLWVKVGSIVYSERERREQAHDPVGSRNPSGPG